MKYLLIICSILLLTSCSNDNAGISTTNNLNGKWIEVETRTDTLSFESWDNKKMLNLSRGKELINGYLLPKSNSGSYEYNLEDQTISLYYMLSSNNKFNSYSFELKDKKLYIGNFYGSTSGSILNFKKIE